MVPAILLLLALVPQLVDRTEELRQPQPARTELTLEQRADIYMARKMYREAIDTYQLAAGQGATARLFNKLGVAHHHLLDLDSAEKYYERALKTDKNHAEAVNNLGTVYYGRKNFKKAAKTYRKALKMNPDSASIHSSLGMTYFARRKYKQAIEEFLTALQLDPYVFENRNSVGTMLQDRSVEDQSKYHYYMAQAFARAGIIERALLYLRRAIEEGYKRRKQIAEDPAFENLRDDPQFQRLVLGEQQAAIR